MKATYYMTRRTFENEDARRVVLADMRQRAALRWGLWGRISFGWRDTHGRPNRIVAVTIEPGRES